MKYTYHIGFFTYNKVCRTLYANETDLYIPNHNECFPNGPHQFFIYNRKTQQFRRFRLYSQNEDYFAFKSEDDINCRIKKEKRNCN
jgi:hypothetical protein